MQTWIKTSPITLVKKVTDDVRECKIINIKLNHNPSSADSETYKLKIATFENGQTAESLAVLNNFKTTINRKGTTSAAVKIN